MVEFIYRRLAENLNVRINTNTNTQSLVRKGGDVHGKRPSGESPQER